jgi:hypothetical protein
LLLLAIYYFKIFTVGINYLEYATNQKNLKDFQCLGLTSRERVRERIKNRINV